MIRYCEENVFRNHKLVAVSCHSWGMVGSQGRGGVKVVWRRIMRLSPAPAESRRRGESLMRGVPARGVRGGSRAQFRVAPHIMAISLSAQMGARKRLFSSCGFVSGVAKGCLACVKVKLRIE